jgi:AGCS family alanine or glycine:cation symporter
MPLSFSTAAHRAAHRLVAVLALLLIPVLAMAQEAAAGAAEEPTFFQSLNQWLDATVGKANELLGTVLFFDVLKPFNAGVEFPLVVAVLVFGATFYTLFFKFINIRGFRHAVDVVRGRFDDPNDEGEVSHFRALTSALSATVGLGNIAGVAVAIQIGGPGAAFWMTVAGLLGMTSKFVECTLGLMYRKVNHDGSISGGPMYYLSRGLAPYGGAFAMLGKVLAIIAAFVMMGGAIGGGNMFQANQAYESVVYTFDLPKDNAVVASIFGLVMAGLTGLVVIGGIRRIGAATARIVPIMAAIYAVGAVAIVAANITQLPAAIWSIIESAFAPDAAAVKGGVIGALIIGFRRAAFSNEAGLGSAAIAHAAAKTKEPVREGFVALLEPFIDTVIICNLTAIVIVITGVWDPSSPVVLEQGLSQGVALTKAAFGSVISWFPYILTACVLLFAYSTMISWCYYGERGWIYLMDHFGDGTGIRTILGFRVIFVLFVYIGTVANLSTVIDFSDLMILSLAFPNIVGCLLMLPVLRRAVDDYWRRLKAGEFKMVK